MARIRTVKPEFFQQESLAKCSPHARLLAIAVLQLCDANGVFRLVPMQVHAHAFPWEAEVKIRELLGELEGVGYLETYTVDGKEYGYVDGFCRHQRLTGKEAQAGGYYPLKNKGSQEDKQGANKGASQGNNRETAGKHLDAQEQGTGEQGTGNRDNGGAAAPFEVDWDSDPQLYARGKAILGKSAGGQIKKVKEAFGSIYNARRVIEAAAQKQNPAEYVEAARRNELERQRRKREPSINQIAAG
jgi:hypothetical protein